MLVAVVAGFFRQHQQEQAALVAGVMVAHQIPMDQMARH
jgi:hypothetical protein